ncbi:nucleotidyltransferase [Spirochaetia bacterium]|nr:nucleotidyltransferase [Spirochaetia bacterium]
MGSRYGGLKQIDRLGQSGEVLLDYSVFDALRAGFKKVVFIIRHDIEKDFREIVLDRMGAHIDYALAYQELSSLIPDEIARAAKANGRTKPWGTTHALLCAEKCIDAPFAIINADDFYGREAFEVMGSYLNSAVIKEGAIVPYDIEKTLSPRGTVTRGVCELVRSGKIAGEYLASVDELMAIEETEGGIINTDPDGRVRKLPRGTPVSMNFWGFPPDIFPAFKRYFDAFLKESGGEPKSECYLPRAADWFIKEAILRFRVLRASSEWFGITYKEDKEMAVNHIKELVDRGVYPGRLWT